MTIQAVIFIHGIGDQKGGYSHRTASLINENALELIRKDTTNSDVDSTGIVYREVWWAPITSRVQSELWKRISRKHDLDYTKLRRFLVDFAGDAIAYQRQEGDRGVYEDVHFEVEKIFSLIQQEYPQESIEYTVIAHSLGSVIASNYAYDNREELTLTNLFTLGSPLAIWLMNEGDVSKADTPILVSRPNGVWVNILDDEDIIGCPLRDVNQHYRNAVDKDIVREIGGLIHRGPVSHIGYWEDRDVVRPIAKKLAMDYLRIHEIKEYQPKEYLKSLDQTWLW